MRDHPNHWIECALLWTVCCLHLDSAVAWVLGVLCLEDESRFHAIDRHEKMFLSHVDDHVFGRPADYWERSIVRSLERSPRRVSSEKDVGAGGDVLRDVDLRCDVMVRLDGT